MTQTLLRHSYSLIHRLCIYKVSCHEVYKQLALLSRPGVTNICRGLDRLVCQNQLQQYATSEGSRNSGREEGHGIR